MAKKKPIGIIILSVFGIIIGFVSFLFGFIGGGLSIVFGGLWIILGLRLLKLQNGARRTILISAVIFFLIYIGMIYVAETADHYLYIGVILQSPLALLNLISLVCLSLPKVKKIFLKENK